jgi:hypothetical protein
MTSIRSTPALAERGRRRRSLWVGLAVVVVAVIAFGVLAIGPRNLAFALGGTVLLEGRVSVSENTVSIETADWTYGMSPVSSSWTDSQGAWHEDGRPACLAPGDFTSTVRFAAVQVSVESVTWRPIVWVDCRGTPIDGAAR